VALILLIDDDGFYRGVLRQILEDGGHRVVEATNGPEGLARFRAGQPDLVITDLRMPGVDGGQVIRKLREMSPGARIIALSGAGPLKGDAPSVAEMGADAVLSKLSPLDEIVAAIARILDAAPS
jgi:CheY-like chemotaxis protein